MDFKNILKMDLNNVFFNTREFAEEHNIEGKVMNVIVDNEHLMKRSKIEYEGVMVGDILYFVNANDFGKPPKVGGVQSFDNARCEVFDVRIDSGVYEIILKKTVS